jgi:hypothetical protein
MPALEALSQALLAQGALAAFALAILAAEIAWFAWHARASRLHRATLPTLLAGTSIMAALYIVLSDGSSALAVAFLLLSLAAHVTDLYIRMVLERQGRSMDQRPRMRGSSASRKPSPM